MTDEIIDENPKQLALWQDAIEIMTDDGARCVLIDGEPHVSILDAYKIYGGSQNPTTDWKRHKGILQRQGYKLEELLDYQFTASDGKRKKSTPIASTEQLMRIAQITDFKEWEPLRAEMARLMANKSKRQFAQIPDKTPVRQSKAFRMHLDANYTPELAERAIDIKRQSQESRNTLSSEWSHRGAKGQDYGRLTNDVTEAATGRTVKQWRDQYGVKGTPREYFSAAKNAALDWVQRVAAGLHKDNDSHGVDELERDIHKVGSVLDPVQLRKLFPDMDLDTPSVPPEQKALSAGGEE